MAFVSDGITLGPSGDGAVFGWELLIACLVRSLVGLFGLALAAVRGLIRLVVGVGAVVFAHSSATMAGRPTTLHFPTSAHTIIYQNLTICRAAA
jgi:hypothetical protein